MAIVNDAGGCSIGEARWVCRDMQEWSMVFAMANGVLLGISPKREGGNLRELGLFEGNNYNDFWKHRLVYGESQSVGAALRMKMRKIRRRG